MSSTAYSDAPAALMNENGVSGKLGGAQVRLKWRPALLLCAALSVGMAIGLLAGGSSTASAQPPSSAPLHPDRPPLEAAATWDHYITHACDEQQFGMVMHKDANGEYTGRWVVDDEHGVTERVMGTGMCHAGHSDDNATSPTTVVPDQQVGFVVVGDFGRDGFCCQHDVAKEMALAAAKLGTGQPDGTVDIVLNVGDAFYETGLIATQAEFEATGLPVNIPGQVISSWKGVYVDPHPELQVPWKSTLGNHEYRGSVQAILDLHSQYPLWELPARYYDYTLPQDAAPADRLVHMIHIDTSVFVPSYWTSVRKYKRTQPVSHDAASPLYPGRCSCDRKALNNGSLSSIVATAQVHHES